MNSEVGNKAQSLRGLHTMCGSRAALSRAAAARCPEVEWAELRWLDAIRSCRAGTSEVGARKPRSRVLIAGPGDPISTDRLHEGLCPRPGFRSRCTACGQAVQNLCRIWVQDVGVGQ